jgi:hypothetical protein
MLLAGNLVRLNACSHGRSAGCLSENYRPQHWPAGKNPPSSVIEPLNCVTGNGVFGRVACSPGHDWADRVPAIAKVLAALRVRSVTLDREDVVYSPDGVSDFDRIALQLPSQPGRLASPAFSTSGPLQ